MTELCEVVITAPDPDWLYSFAHKLVEDRLAASAHNFTPVRSIYRWQGQVHERAEGRVSLNTNRGRVAEIVARAQREHPYQVSGVSTRPIIDETRTTSRRSPKRPIPGADNARTGHLTRLGPTSTDELHEITTTLHAAPRSCPPSVDAPTSRPSVDLRHVEREHCMTVRL